LVDIVQQEDTDADTLHFIQTFFSRYVTQGRPLSGYFIVCCVIETQWTVLAQALAPPRPTSAGYAAEAAAANRAWLSLMRHAADELDISEGVRDTLKSTIKYSMQCFTDLLVQIKEMDTEPSLDTYAWETMSESLVSNISLVLSLQPSEMRPQKLASICSVAVRELDEKLLSRLLLLLSDKSPVSDNLVQEAALKATTVLVQK
jgi:phosphatidylinositol 4-kinase